jgi:uncharacterized protein
VLAAPPTGGSTGVFQLTSPMKVNSRPNLAAYISADSDPGPDYGKITVLRLPTNSVIDGPEQIFNSFNTTPAISKDITLLGSGGSQVIHGNLLTLPIGNSFLYVEPLYVQGATSNGYPVLRRILVAYGDKIGYAADVSDALLNLSQADVGITVSGTGSTNTTTPTPTPTPSTTGTSPPSGSTSPTAPATSTNALFAQLNAALTALSNAYKTGDLGAIGTNQATVARLLQQYLASLPSSSAPASSTPASSPTPTPTKS